MTMSEAEGEAFRTKSLVLKDFTNKSLKPKDLAEATT
jgi:hypothetical protein